MTLPLFFQNSDSPPPTPTPPGTNFLLCYPHVPYFGSFLSTTPTGSVRENVIGGERRRHFQLASPFTFIWCDFDFGSDINPQYALVARVDLITRRDSGPTTFHLIGSASPSFTSPESVSQVITTADLMGPRGEDYLMHTDFSGAYRYWRIGVTTADAYAWEIAKFYFGTFFDFGREPTVPDQKRRGGTGGTKRDAPYTFTLNWQGVTDAQVNALQSQILRCREVMPIFLHTRSYDHPLSGAKLLHAWITSADVQKENFDSSVVTLTFEELL